MKMLVLLVAAGAAAVAASAFAQGKPMTAGDLQDICLGSDVESKAACRFYIFGLVQGMNIGMHIADGKTRAPRPCIPENLSAEAFELAVKMKMGQDLMVFPNDRTLEASGFVGAIVATSFPCKRQP